MMVMPQRLIILATIIKLGLFNRSVYLCFNVFIWCFESDECCIKYSGVHPQPCCTTFINKQHKNN
jgi:hypothetical protein